jgi:hypothetical protein
VGLRPFACWDCVFESRWGMDVCLLWVLCVVMYRCLHRADHSSRGALHSVIAKPRKWGDPGPLGAVASWGGRGSSNKNEPHVYSCEQ